MSLALASREKLDAVLGRKPGEAPRTLSTGNVLERFAKGFGLPFRGLKLIFKHGVLFKWSALTAAISAVLLGALLVGLFTYTGDLVSLVWEKPEGWLRFFWYTLAVIVFATAFVIGASTIPPIATAPITDPLTANAEKILGAPVLEGGGVAKMAKETAHAVVKAVMRLALLYAGHAVLLVIWIIPGIGQAVWTPLAMAWTIFWLAYEYLDIPANRHDYRFSEVLRTVGDNLALSVGFGTAVYLILWVPLLNVLFIPVAAVGATILFVDLRATGRMPPSDTERRLGLA